MGNIPLKNPIPGIAASEILSLASAPVAGVSEVQRITITGTPTGGTFTLSGVDRFGAAFTTDPIAYNAAASAVVTAVNAELGSGSVTGSGGSLPGSAVDLTFAGEYANRNVTQMTANGAALTGGTSPTVTITTQTAGVTASYAGRIAAGGLLVDTSNKTLSQNTGTAKAPAYTTR